MKLMKNYAKHCGHCGRNTLPAYEYEFTCLARGYKVIKLKHELTRIQRKKNY